MAQLKAKVYFANGGLMEVPFNESDLQRLRALQSQGIEGRALVHELLADDWGSPLRAVRVIGEDPEGRTVDIVISYG